MKRLTMPRAGRPVKRLVRAHLYARRAEGERRRDALAVGDAAGRHDRHANFPHELSHERERADLRGEIVGQKHPAMTARFVALRDDDVRAVRFKPARLGYGRRRR